MKAALLLLFTVFFFALNQTSLAQAPTEKSEQEQKPAEEPPVEESIKEDSPSDETPSGEEPKEKRKRKKDKKEKATENELPSVDEIPSEDIKKEKKRGKKNKVDEPTDEPPADNSSLEEPKPEEAAPAPLKDDKKKDTWFRVFKMQRCPIKSCETKMVHLHNGKKFRGRKKLKFIQNPKTGELQRVPVTDPGKRKKSTKLKKDHEYQKDFKLPEKPIEPRGK